MKSSGIRSITPWQRSLSKKTTSPKPGDLVLMKGHVELFIGNGKTIGHGSKPINHRTVPHRKSTRGAWFATYDFLNR